MVLSPLLFNTVSEVLANAITQKKKLRDVKIKKEIKLSLHVDHMTTYLENPRKSTGTLL